MSGVDGVARLLERKRRLKSRGQAVALTHAREGLIRVGATTTLGGGLRTLGIGVHVLGCGLVILKEGLSVAVNCSNLKMLSGLEPF